jgi:type II secretory ATPase GspE/PulE/Tfp pilus assembly ATPase PilB-like protein
MTQFPTLLAQGLSLMSWWAPIVLVLLFTGWAWVVSSIFDKDAARFYLARRKWNLIHMGFGFAALVLAIALPLKHFIVLPAVFAVLMADLVMYFFIRNGDERIPDGFKWSLDLSKMRAASDKKKDKGKAQSLLIFKGPAGELAVPAKEAPEYELRTTAEALIMKLIDVRGYQLDIAPSKEGSYAVAALVDGVYQKLDPLQPAMAIGVIDVYKAAAGLDLQDRRRRLVGDFKLGPSGPGNLTPARVTTLGNAQGVQMSLLLDPERQVTRKLDDLGFLESQLKDVKELIETKTGVVLLVAPQDNGRTTTLYAFTRAHDAYTSNVQTIEFEPQLTIEGVRQNKFDPKADGAEFSTTVRSILRRDPDVVAVAEMPDDNTGKECAKSDTDRTRVYLSIPVDGALLALQRYAKAVGDQKLAAKSLHGVIGSRLARRLCQNCRVAFQPAPDMLKKLGLPADTKQLFKKSGQVLIKDKPATCPQCGGSGFFGQVGIFEVYPIGNEERELIAQNDITGLKAVFRTKKRPSLQAAALQHAILGNTSVEEVIRITQPQEAPRPAAPAGQSAPPKTAAVAPPPTKKA